ncbi:hypothetical protein AgCh_032784 [Apium graveolens]
MDNKAQCSSCKRVDGKVAIVTGAARGIGGATAKLLAEHGAHVVIADILDELGSSLANSIGGRYIHCDVSKESDVEAAVQFALTWKGKLDIMFNNAGIPGYGGSIANLKMDEMAALLSINLNGVVHGIKHAARAMIAGGKGGSIICTSSTAAFMGGLGSHPYTMSKEAIIGVVRSSACDLGVHGIRVNCIVPHGVPSEMLVNAYRLALNRTDVDAEEVSKIVAERASLLRGRGGRLEDAAYAALFLASDESGFITGHNLIMDGGYTAANNLMAFIYQE